MLTEKDYCDYDTCVALKELGYPEHEILTYDFELLLYEAQKWLREEKGVIVEPTFAYMDEKWDKYYSVQIVTDLRFDDESYTYECDTMTLGEFKGYENALSKGIKEAVKILKEEVR